MSAAELRRLAGELVRLERQVKALATQPQLAYSSLEDGALEEYDGDGQLVQIIGRQFDGTHVAASVAGPVPPVPSPPTVGAALGGLVVAWDGLWADEAAITPMDFARVEIHAAPAGEVFDPASATHLRNDFLSPRGGEQFIVLPDGDYVVALVARSLSGKRSAASEQVPGAPISPSSIGGNRIFHGPELPTGQQIGDLWLAEVAPGPPAQYVTRRWDGTGWADVADQGVTQALLDAAAAAQLAGEKAVTYRQDDQPSPDPEGPALWWDTDDGNRLRSWDAANSQWVDVRLGTGAIEPQSLVASDVIATGTITAALLESVMVLTSRLVAGDPDGARVEINALGFRRYNASNQVEVDISPTTALFSGTVEAADIIGSIFRTGISGSRLVIDYDVAYENGEPVYGETYNPRIDFFPDDVPGAPVRVIGGAGGVLGKLTRELLLLSGQYGTAPDQQALIRVSSRDETGSEASFIQLESDNVTGKAVDRLVAVTRQAVSGGGRVTYSSTRHLSWSARFMVGISTGRGPHFSTGGYFEITQPPASTLIRGEGGASDVSATSAGIPITAWQALYYELPIGGGDASQPNNFRIVSYTSWFVAPAHWVLLAYRNSDDDVVYVANGVTLRPGESVEPRMTDGARPFAEAAGIVAVAGVVAGGVLDVAVSFPPSRFTQVPIVMANAYDDSGRYKISVLNRSASGCTLRVNNVTAGNGAAAFAGWHAMQMTPVSAAG